MSEPTNQSPSAQNGLNRRRFLHRSSLFAGTLFLPAAVLGRRTASGAQNRKSPNDRLNIGAVGIGVRGLDNVAKCETDNVVAFCDVDWTTSASAFKANPGVSKYQDFRKMLDKEDGLDAVVISTPDHTHAVIAAEAMKRGKHVYVETPLTHDVWEARRLATLAAETGVVTQMGNERHSGAGMKRAVEMLWGGGLGPIREVHCWTNRPQWPQGIDRPTGSSKPPAGLNWDLWLGPAPTRNYNPAYHPYRWRGWLDFGTGALGAMGCQLLDVAFWGLRLDLAETCTVAADSTGVNSETYPEASTVRYTFSARGEDPPVTVIWSDGGRLPPTPEGLPYHREIGSNGTLFLGEEHPMVFGPTVFGTNPGQVGPRVIPEFTTVQPRRAFEKIPSIPDGSWVKGNRQIQEWIAACKSGKQPSASFAYSAALTEMVLLGNVALQAGEPIEWDSKQGQVTNVAGADDLIRREYRDGWSI